MTQVPTEMPLPSTAPGGLMLVLLAAIGVFVGWHVCVLALRLRRGLSELVEADRVDVAAETDSLYVDLHGDDDSSLSLAYPFSDPMYDANISEPTPADKAKLDKLVAQLGHEEIEAASNLDRHDHDRLLDMVADVGPAAAVRAIADHELRRATASGDERRCQVARMLHDDADLLDDSNGVSEQVDAA